MKKISSVILASLLLVALAACGEGSATPAPSGGTTGATDGALVVDTGVGAEFKYAEATLNASAGEVKLTLNNKSAQPHNWTLVKVGEEAKADSEASAAGAPDYKAASALAQTKTINAGETDTITFTATPGTYSYICTFPGHFLAGMKGTIVVK
ncbi:MAG TPA: plastocyanin/azurin family copper-binding protein [Herpetosiphonaceae bacterium]